MVIFRKKNCFALALMGLIAASTSAFAAKETPIQTLQNQINDLKVESSNIDESISENSKALDQAKKCLKNPDDPMCEDANPGDCACWPSSAQGGPCGVDVWDTHECEVLNHDAFRRVKSNAETSGRMLVFSMESGDLSAQAGQVYQECFNKAYPTSAQTKITGYYRQSLNAAQKRAACEVLKGAGNLSGECKQTVNSCLGNKVKQQVQQLTGNIQESKKQKQKVIF
ncbi:MAG: hypothetical protein EOP04_05140 [Proteobacteria bacterium]|nr:MAG: hypothetical protein EOP04_05140 [Pseudomonadota bacterium]